MINFVTEFYRYYRISYFSCVDLRYKGDLSYKIHIVAQFLCLSKDIRRLSFYGH